MTPEELEKLPKPLECTMSDLEFEIMEEIIERIKHVQQITPTIDWMISRLAAIGESKARIKELIKKALEKSNLDIDEIYKQAVKSDYVRTKELYEAVGKDYVPYEDNQWLQQVVEAARQQTKDSLRPLENITQTTGFMATVNGKKTFTPMTEYLTKSLDKAMMGISSGAMTYSKAIEMVIDEMTMSGIRVVNYESGKSDRIEVAARRAVMTGVAQMTDKVSEKNAKELNTDYWEVDWHSGARNTGTGYLNHQSWQGRIHNSEEMKTVCGLGEMLGFAGINCYHVRFPFILGVTERKYTDEWLEEQNRRENEKKPFRGKEYDRYGALQYQRKLERTIRKQKQDIKLLEKGGADKDAITAAKCRLQLTNKTYVEFSKEMGIPQQLERLKIPKSIPSAKLGSRSTEGQAPGKPELLGKISPNDTDRAIEYYNSQIRNEEIEYSFIIDRNGNVFYSVGDKESVSLEGIDLKGAVITHNHPESNGILSFGEDDFNFLKANQDIQELQCVNPEYTYKVSLLKDITDVVYNRIYLDGFRYAGDLDFEAQDAAMRVLAERGYVKYERVEFKPRETE